MMPGMQRVLMEGHKATVVRNKPKTLTFIFAIQRQNKQWLSHCIQGR